MVYRMPTQNELHKLHLSIAILSLSGKNNFEKVIIKVVQDVTNNNSIEFKVNILILTYL